MASAADPVTQAARAGDPDRYLAALYAPEPARGVMIALAAFSADLDRIVSAVREPLLAEIRLQWWRDALSSAQRGDATGHPIADRLAPHLASNLLPPGLLQGMIDAAPRPDLAALAADPQALNAHLNKSAGAAFGLAARALGATHSDPLDAACRNAAASYGLAQALVMAQTAPPALIAAASQALPAALSAVHRLDSAYLPAFLPLTMTPVYLRQAESGASGAPMPLTRWWRLARANLTGRLG